jgi:hypothetical protein
VDGRSILSVTSNLVNLDGREVKINKKTGKKNAIRGNGYFRATQYGSVNCVSEEVGSKGLIERKMGEAVRMRNAIPDAIVRVIRHLADRYVWTQPSILATFRCRPRYQAAFRNTWLSLMWGDPSGRRLREAVAVAVSTANQCVY